MGNSFLSWFKYSGQGRHGEKGGTCSEMRCIKGGPQMKVSWVQMQTPSKRHPESRLEILHPKGASDVGCMVLLHCRRLVDASHELGGGHTYLAMGYHPHQKTIVDSCKWKIRESKNKTKQNCWWDGGRGKSRTWGLNSERADTSPLLDLQVMKAISIHRSSDHP